MTTTTDITPEDLARFEAELRGGELTWHGLSGVHRYDDACMQAPYDHSTAYITSRTPAFRRMKPAPLTTADGREQWMELLWLLVEPYVEYEGPGTKTVWRAFPPGTHVKLSSPQFASPAEAITAAVNAACKQWKESRDE